MEEAGSFANYTASNPFYQFDVELVLETNTVKTVAYLYSVVCQSLTLRL